MKPTLFADTPPVGLLKGFSPVPHQLEVEVVVPHSEQGLPGFGEFLLVEINATTALVGRVSRYQAAGQLTTAQGDAYLADLAKNAERVPAPIMQQMLRYNLKIQVLGQLRTGPTGLQFGVGERAFATMGRPVRQPSEAALAFLCNVGLESDPTAAPLGHLAYGLRVLDKVPVNFSVARLKGKRSFVFARAGYGKSNLIKYLVAQLYSSPPDVGLLIFDPEGEYALPDAHGRPGLVNVPGLKDRISLYTHRRVPPEFAAIRRGAATLNFGDFAPQDIVAAFVAQEKQETNFANVLRSLDWQIWKRLVAHLAKHEYATDEKDIAALLRYRARGRDGVDVSLSAIVNNLVPHIRRLHDPESRLGNSVIEELRQGRIVIVDISLLGSDIGIAVTGLLLQRVLHHNIRHLTDPSGPQVRCLAVLEEAQTVLGDRRLDDSNVFVRWVKEGRKYGLGAILVTQQPAAISDQIISQGDNFFALHLLNDSDLQTLKRHNAHYTDEILNYLRAEPIIGNCYFWSAPHQPFVLPVRVANFEAVCAAPPVAAAVEKRSPANMAGAVKEALTANPRVWLYPVSQFNGREEKGWVAFSMDYLQTAVSQATGHVPDDVAREMENVLRRHKVRTGYAVLEGVTRRVWAIPVADIKLQKGKSLRGPAVAVSDKL